MRGISGLARSCCAVLPYVANQHWVARSRSWQHAILSGPPHAPCDVSILAAGAAYSGAEGWLSYGIYADGRLAPAGGPSEQCPNILVRIRHAPAAAFLTDGLPHLAPRAPAAAGLPGSHQGIPSPAPCIMKMCDVRLPFLVVCVVL